MRLARQKRGFIIILLHPEWLAFPPRSPVKMTPATMAAPAGGCLADAPEARADVAPALHPQPPAPRPVERAPNRASTKEQADRAFTAGGHPVAHEAAQRGLVR